MSNMVDRIPSEAIRLIPNQGSWYCQLMYLKFPGQRSIRCHMEGSLMVANAIVNKRQLITPLVLATDYSLR